MPERKTPFVTLKLLSIPLVTQGKRSANARRAVRSVLIIVSGTKRPTSRASWSWTILILARVVPANVFTIFVLGKHDYALSMARHSSSSTVPTQGSTRSTRCLYADSGRRHTTSVKAFSANERLSISTKPVPALISQIRRPENLNRSVFHRKQGTLCRAQASTRRSEWMSPVFEINRTDATQTFLSVAQPQAIDQSGDQRPVDRCWRSAHTKVSLQVTSRRLSGLFRHIRSLDLRQALTSNNQTPDGGA
jgi:hypothetical protein